MNFSSPLSSSFVCRTIAIALAAVAFSTLHAQQMTSPAKSAFVLTSALDSPLPDFRYKGDDVGGSESGVSSSAAPATVAEERENLSEDASQPPPRRRVYGRPRYADRMHNADGSTKVAFEAGVGFAAPAGSTAHYQTIAWKFSVGAGLNFSKKFGILGQFDYDRMNVPQGVVQSVQADYQAANPQTDFSGFDMNTHIWSITANPIYNYYVGEKAGAYVVGGLGYGRKTTNFTLPQIGYYCDYFYGCYPVQSNQNVDQYTNGGLILNAGLGFTYKISHFGNEKLFAEARYQWLNTSVNSTTYYTPNGYRTGYFPVTVGVRW